MKATCMLSLSFVFSAAVIARADTSAVSISNLTFVHRTNLIDIDQSQIFETLSMADEFTRLPVSSYKTARVYFITSDKGQMFSKLGGGGNNDNAGGSGSPEFDDPTKQLCTGEGYKYDSSNCSNGMPTNACPYNSSYFKTCCDSAYNYTSENCSLLNTSSSCGNKYKCDCTEEKYPVTSESCISPQIPLTESGASCAVNGEIRYTKCVCPTGVSAPYGCEEYYGGACNTVCKKAKSDNCDNRTTVQTPYGCEKYYADCSSKCEKAYTDNCRNRTAVSAPYGCESYYADCASKCEVAKAKPADNCANRTAVDAPYGCESYYADCSSKCEKAEKVFLYGDGTVSSEYPLSGKIAIGIVISKAWNIAMALTDVKEDGSAGSQEMPWSNEIYDLPNLINYKIRGSLSVFQYDPSSEADKILACGEPCGGTPAATACSLYEPEGCTADFCRAGKWFLPSGSFLEDISYRYHNRNYKKAFKLVGGDLQYGTYWSSTEYGQDEYEGLSQTAWSFSLKLGSGLGSPNIKTNENLVRPIIQFKPVPLYTKNETL